MAPFVTFLITVTLWPLLLNSNALLVIKVSVSAGNSAVTIQICNGLLLTSVLMMPIYKAIHGPYKPTPIFTATHMLLQQQGGLLFD